MRFDNVQIRYKFLLVFGLVLGSAFIECGYALFSFSQAGQQLQQATKVQLPNTAELGAIAMLAAVYRVDQFQYTLASDADRPDVEKDMQSVVSEIDVRKNSYLALVDNVGERLAFERFSKLWKRYLEIDLSVKKLMSGGLPLQATDLLNSDAKKTFDAARLVLGGVISSSTARAQLLQVESSKSYQFRFLVIVISLVSTSVFSGSVVWLIARRISRAVTAAQHTAEKVALGHLDERIEVTGSDEIGRLMASLASMRSGLTRIVREVREGADVVSHATVEIAQGNVDLSQRTELQGLSTQQLVETLAKLEQAAVSNVHDVNAAAEMCSHSGDAAERSGISVRELLVGMGAINDSARKIFDISSLIDGIAQQTNILAINAAIEAARAGSQGRGFAVVAGEVRSLAQRAAVAAHDIKSLVTASVERIASGMDLAKQTVDSITFLENSTKKVVLVVGKISLSSRSQSNDVQKMTQYIVELDSGTQQNAALVEQLAAASASLQMHAKLLSETMEVFHLPEMAEVNERDGVSLSGSSRFNPLVQLALTG